MKSLLFFLVLTLQIPLDASYGFFSVEAELLYCWSCPENHFLCVDQFLVKEFYDNFRTSPEGFLIFQSAAIDVEEKNKFLETPYEGQFGFRLGGHYQCPFQRWEFGIIWTHFHPELKKTVHLPLDHILIPLSGDSSFNTTTLITYLSVANRNFLNIIFDKVASTWEMNLNLVDLEWKYHFNNYWSIPLHTYFGIRFGNMDQKLRLDATGSSSSFLIDFRYNKDWSADFSGAGPLFGVEVEKSIWCGLGLYLDGSASLIYGEKKLRTLAKGERESCQTPDVNSTHFSERVQRSRYCSIPVTDLDVGLFWDSAFCGTCQFIRLSLGWEFHTLFGFGVTDGDYQDTTFSQVEHNVSTQGIKLSMEIGF